MNVIDKANKLAKYRPSLPAHLITHILKLARLESPTATTASQDSLQLIGILAPFEAKILAGSLTPAYITDPVSLLSKDERTLAALRDETSRSVTYTLRGSLYPTKEAYWEACYKLTEAKSTGEVAIEGVSVSTTEIAAAKEHAYLHDLMEPEAKAEFEAKMFSSL